jgi:Phage integrase family
MNLAPTGCGRESISMSDVDGPTEPGDATRTSRPHIYIVLRYRSTISKSRLATSTRSSVPTVIKRNGRKARTSPSQGDCHQVFHGIDLHWHDLRHEYASRLVERGVPLSQVGDLLGHASILTTERYDNHGFAALQQAAGRLESGKSFRQLKRFKCLGGVGPPGDRTRDTVIKSHVLYH